MTIDLKHCCMKTVTVLTLINRRARSGVSVAASDMMKSEAEGGFGLDKRDIGTSSPQPVAADLLSCIFCQLLWTPSTT